VSLRGTKCRLPSRSGIARQPLMPAMLTAMAETMGLRLGIRMISWRRLCCTTTCRFTTVRPLSTHRASLKRFLQIVANDVCWALRASTAHASSLRLKFLVPPHSKSSIAAVFAVPNVHRRMA